MFWELFKLLNIVLPLFLAPHLEQIFRYFEDKRIEVIGSYISLWGIIVLVKYTWETQKTREDAKEREVIELRGYFGLDTNNKPNFGNHICHVYFKNFGKTPLFEYVMVISLRNREDRKITELSRGIPQAINPGQTIPYAIDVPEQIFDNKQFDIIFYAQYKTYSLKNYEYNIRITPTIPNYQIQEEKERLV